MYFTRGYDKMIYGKIFAYFCMGKDIFGVRADVFLATNGYAKSRQRAQEMIRAGLVLCGGKPIIKPSEQLGTQAKITVLGEVHPYVGRGGVKLEKALRRFSVDPAGRRCCDIGASTGGFTDCLLRRGAAFVYAVDSGTDQLDPSLRADARVCSMEKCNAKTLSPQLLGGKVFLCSMFVSFTSALPFFKVVSEILEEDGVYILLIKPQFEVGRAALGKGGIVHDRRAAAGCVQKLCGAAEQAGLFLHGICQSPIRGGDGNIEFLAVFKKERPGQAVLPQAMPALLSLLYEKEAAT